MPAALTLLMTVVVWHLAVTLFEIPSYLIPSPVLVFEVMAENAGYLALHTWYTTLETLGGFALSVALGVPLAILLVWSTTLERAIMPLLVLSQTFPKVAIAPLLIIWFGFGVTTKVIVSFLVAFFPIVISGVVGMRAVENDLVDLVRSMKGTTLQIFWRVRLPYALPHLFGGFKVAMAFAIVGAVVGEWVGSDRGLGHVLLRTNANLETPLLFAVLVVLMFVGMLLYYAVALAEHVSIRWHASQRDSATFLTT